MCVKKNVERSLFRQAFFNWETEPKVSPKAINLANAGFSFDSDPVFKIAIDIRLARAYSSFFLLEAWAIFIITMADFEWNFRETFPMLFTQAEKPLPGVLLVNLNGKPLTNGLLSSDNETYTVTLSEDLTDRIVTGELEAEPCYYYVNNFEDSLAPIHLFGLELHRPATRTFKAGLGQSRQKED